MNPKIKICLFLHSLAGGGAERFMMHLVNNLSRETFDINLVLLKGQGEYCGMLPSDIKVWDLDLKSFRLSQIPNPIWIIKIGQVFKKINPQVIFSTMTTTNLLAIVARCLFVEKSALIIQEAGILGDHFKYERFSSVKKIIYKLLAPRADLIVVPAKAMADDLEKLIQANSKMIKIIPNILDTHHMDEYLKEGNLSKDLEMQKKAKIVVSMGRLERIKGFDLGIRSFYELQRKVPSYYWILGQGTQEENLKCLVRELGIVNRVNFLGFQKNPYLFLKNADCFLLPSRSEGHPYTLMEALYCQLPCVATHYSDSVKEIIKDKENGMIVECGNPIKMAEVMELILKDTAVSENLKRNARKAVSKYYVDEVLPQYEDIFITYAKKNDS